MSATQAALERLREIPNVQVWAGAPLAPRTRFGIGGPAALYGECGGEEALAAALGVAQATGLPWAVIGGGTNLIVSDQGFGGLVLRLTASGIGQEGRGVTVEAGAQLEALVEFSIGRGLAGLETLAGIPGTVGGAVYGNAGAYGHSIGERVRAVRILDGARARLLQEPECAFAYRESIFKRRKEWVIVGCELELDVGEAAALRRTAEEILELRNRKFPPTLKCAGSIFKNLLWEELGERVRQAVPAELVREGKVPAAYLLEQAGAKGLARGGLRVAGHHANLIYNDGAGTASDLRALIGELKARVRDRFGLEMEEEVQYLG